MEFPLCGRKSNKTPAPTPCYSPSLLDNNHFLPKRKALPFSAQLCCSFLSSSTTAEAPLACSFFAALASSGLKTLPVPPRPTWLAPWLERRTTLVWWSVEVVLRIYFFRGRHVRLNILASARLGSIQTLCHVARTAAAGGDDRGLEGGCLEILGLNGGGELLVDDVTGATAPRRLKVRHGYTLRKSTVVLGTLGGGTSGKELVNR